MKNKDYIVSKEEQIKLKQEWANVKYILVKFSNLMTKASSSGTIGQSSNYF